MLRSLLLTLTLTFLVVSSKEKLNYLSDTGYPMVEDFGPHRILVQAVAVDSNPTLQVSCSKGDTPQDVAAKPVDGGLLVLEKMENHVLITQSISGSRFRFHLEVTCAAFSTPVLQFQKYKGGVYMESYCYSDDDDNDNELAISLSWTRAWAQLQHSAPVLEDESLIVSRLRPRRVHVPTDGSYMQLWDVVEVAIDSSIINYVHVTLGCVRVYQPPALVVKLPTTVLDEEEDPTKTKQDEYGDNLGFPDDENSSPQLPLVPLDCDSQPIQGCPLDTVQRTVPCGYVFFPSKTFAGYNLGKYHGSDIHVLAQYCNQQSPCLAFDSGGWYKRALPTQSEWQDHGGPCEGLFVKEELVNEYFHNQE